MNLNNTPLYDALRDHKKLERISFHTPGHKNNFNFLQNDIFSLDYTELPDTDSLFDSSGPIFEAEKKAAKLFGANKTLFSAGGCTLCIQAMLMSIILNRGMNKKNDGRVKIIFSRIIHRSVINTISLLDIHPIWVMPRQDAGSGLPGRIHADDIEAMIKQNLDVKAVYITSPDYFGVMSDIESIARVCKKYKVPLLVDNAHGSHLKFLSKDFHPLALGATMVADSAHKTLPVLTGGALLHVAEKNFAGIMKESMALFGSTSPSYPIMVSLDIARSWLETNGKREFQILEQRVSSIIDLANSLGIETPKGFVDTTRITLNTKSRLGISGLDAAEHMRRNGIEPEYANLNYVVFIPTPANKDRDLDNLEIALNKLVLECKRSKLKEDFNEEINTLPILKQVYLPKEALLSESEIVNLDEALNKVCAQIVCPCPPGIPIAMPGEVLDGYCIDFLLRYGISKIKVLK